MFSQRSRFLLINESTFAALIQEFTLNFSSKFTTFVHSEVVVLLLREVGSA